MSTIYYPVLKGCLGEWVALANLRGGCASSMLPTIEVPPVGLKYEEEPGVPSGKKKTVREHVTHFCKNMIKHVPPAWDFGIDGHRCLKRTKSHSQLYRQILLDARREKLNAVPVTDLRRPPHYQIAIQSIAAETEQKLIVRINPDEFLNPIATVRTLEELASTFGWRFDRLTLLIDLKQELKLSMGSVPDVYEAFAESTEVINDLAGVGLVLTSMNDAVTKGLKPFQTRDVRREDLRIWQQIQASRKDYALPGFGDYGVLSPKYPTADFRMITNCGKIRYSLRDRWVIFRGKKIEEGDDQFHQLARMVTTHEDYYGADTSWGDQQISKCATLQIGPGSQTNWVSYTVNHHLSIMPPLLASAA